MAENKDNLMLFMSKGTSLKSWSRTGVLDREIEPYLRMSEYFKKIYVFTYGDEDDLNYKPRKDNVRILTNKFLLPAFLYQFIGPFLHLSQIKKTSFLKTNQVSGSWAAIMSKILKPKTKLIARSGYVASLNSKLYKDGWLKRTYIRINEKILYFMADKIFITTEESKQYLSGRYPKEKKKIYVLPNSINTEVFKKIDIAKEYDIGYVGRLQKDKNLLSLLKSIRGLGLKVCFIGQGEEKEVLLKKAKEWDTSLTIIRNVPNYSLPEFYNKFKVFVFPSLHEGNPKALLEAMACELFVVGCDVFGVKNLINDRQNGILSGTDEVSLKKSIQDAMKAWEEKGVILGKNARKFILDNHSLEKVTAKEISIIKEN